MATNPTTRTCKFCDEEIERIPGARLGASWVETRSGDDGGYYDICPDAPTASDWEDGRHAPAPLTALKAGVLA